LGCGLCCACGLCGGLFVVGVGVSCGGERDGGGQIGGVGEGGGGGGLGVWVGCVGGLHATLAPRARRYTRAGLASGKLGRARAKNTIADGPMR